MRTKWWALVLLCLAQFMVILDVTVVNVALPVIATDLGLDRAALTWVVTAYTLCFGGLMLLGGRLADVAGRRRVFLVGLAVFAAASLASGLAGDAVALVVARGAQGAGAALLSPAALSIVTTMFHGAERNRALGVWSAVGGAGAAVGVLLGGVFTAGPGWEWVFFVNVPIGLLVAAAVPKLVPPGGVRTGTVDLPGALIAVAAVGALIYGLVRAGDTGWTGGSTPFFLAAGLVLLAAFVLVERRAADPLLRLELLTRRPVVAGNVVMLAASGLLLATFFLSSQYLQHVLRLDALEAGLLFLPVALVAGLGTHLGVRALGRFGGRPVVVIGFGLAAVGAVLLARVPASGNALAAVLPGFLVLGLGLGAMLVTATTTTMTHVGPHDAGTTSGVLNTSHELGATLGIAFVSTIAAQGLAVGAVHGFNAAFTAIAIVSAVVAIAVPWLVPAGRTSLPGGPVFAH